MGPSVCVCEREYETWDTKPSVCCSARVLLSICTWLNVQCFKHTSYSSSSPFSLPQTVQRWFSESAAPLSLPRKLFLIWCHRKWTEMSGGLFASHGLNRFLFSAPSCVMLSHSHLLQPFFSQPLSHISVSFCFSYLLCPPPGSARLFLSQMFFFPFLLLGLLLLPHSHYPTLFCSHFIFHLNTFSLYHSHTHASPPQSNQSGSSPPPPPPTYHRVYCICHHVLLA